ncbi:MAG: hypothetical protein LIP09_11525 [Bacteroidales bacterium]|nr:hypothetical protein [Bacteroidales bacterium]
MLHIVNIMLGGEFAELAKGVKGYVLKHGSPEEWTFYSGFMFSYPEAYNSQMIEIYKADKLKSQENAFESGLSRAVSAGLDLVETIKPQQYQEYLISFFSRLYDTTITIENPGDNNTLHLCLFVQAYDDHSAVRLTEVLEAISHCKRKYCADVWALSSDYAHLLLPDKAEELPTMRQHHNAKAVELLSWLERAKQQYPSIMGRLIYTQMCNMQGQSLNLDQEGMIRVMGEYTLLSITNYFTLHNANDEDVQHSFFAFGLSELSLDRYSFVQYLLHKTYLHILTREHVEQQSVDVNKMSHLIQLTLVPYVHVYRDFYDQEVVPLIKANLSPKEIIARLDAPLREKIDKLSQDLQRFIGDESLSLPEKQGALAQLLGEDDPLLEGYLFDQDQYTLDDCIMEALALFVEANNYAITDERYYDAILSDEKEIREDEDGNREIVPVPAEVLIKGIKKSRIEMRDSTNYIREKTKQLKALGQERASSHASHGRLTKDGYVFENTTFRLQGDEIIESPLNDSYEPHPNSVRSLDLRKYFNPVKNQGDLGACACYSLVSIYEYMLKKSLHTNQALSENFVYYNVRKESGKVKEDTGSNFLQVVKSMSKYGVCSEALHPMLSPATLSTEPSEDAYADAKERQVLQAKNVEPNLEALKSALADGYPVAVSVQIFDSFSATQKGFVTKPSDYERRQGQGGWHAMVACGYDDENKIVVLRNSWGRAFGDDGYCYMPYSYFRDKDLFRAAVIITQISGTEVKQDESYMAINFNMADAAIHSAILRNSIEEEKEKLEQDNQDYQQKLNRHLKMVEKVGKIRNREILQENYKNNLTQKIFNLDCQISDLESERNKQLRENEEKEQNYKLKLWGAIGALVVVTGLFMYNDIGFFIQFSLQEWDWILIWLGVFAISCLGYYMFARYHRNQYVLLKQKFADRLEELTNERAALNREMGLVPLQFHLAGMLCDRFYKLQHNLRQKYSSLRSYVGNLRVWRAEEFEEVVSSELYNRQPFLSILSKEQLNQYFDACKEDIARDLWLSKLFQEETFEVDENRILIFKNALKSKIIGLLASKITDFNMVDYLGGRTAYPYLDSNKKNVQDYISELDNNSGVFVQLNPAWIPDPNFGENFTIFLDYKNDSVLGALKESSKPYLTAMPQWEHLNNPYKIIMVKTRKLTLADLLG